MMKLRNFPSDNPNLNPFNDHISDEQFAHMIKSEFERGVNNSYSNLSGLICYRRRVDSMNSSNYITCYITEDGIAVDIDYDCGGNLSNKVWWFEDGVGWDRDYKAFTKYATSFEEAWNEMIEYCISY